MTLQADVIHLNRGGRPFRLQLDLPLTPGALTFLAGPGKTASLRILQGTGRPETGLITLDGVTLYHGNGQVRLESLDRPFALVDATELPSPEKTVAWHLSRALVHWPTRSRNHRFFQVLGRAGLDDNARTRVGHLTLSQRWQLKLALALAKPPRLLLVDDLFDGFTPADQRRMAWHLRKLIQAENVPALVGALDLTTVFHRGDQVVRIRPLPARIGGRVPLFESAVA